MLFQRRLNVPFLPYLFLSPSLRGGSGVSWGEGCSQGASAVGVRGEKSCKLQIALTQSSDIFISECFLPQPWKFQFSSHRC